MAEAGAGAGDPGSDRQSVRERAFRILAGTVGALFLAFAALGGAFLWYDDATNWVIHTHRVRSNVADLLQNLTQAESAERAYILTGDRQFSAQAAATERGARAALDAVERLTKDNPAQQARARGLRRTMDVRLRVIDRIIAARAAGDPVAAIGIMRQGEGIAAMAEVRRQLVAFDQAESQLETRRRSDTETIRVVLLLALVTFAAALAGLFIKAMRDLDLDRRREAEVSRRLRELLADRTLLLDEVNHRVKNSLQQIASVVRLQARAVPHPDAREALNKTLDRIMAVGRLHEQLYKTSGEVGRFDAGLYAETLARDLVESLGREDVTLETEVTAAALDLRQAVPLALILNELITNALKYGCPVGKPCRIRVAFETEGENYRLSVSDDGPGLPPPPPQDAALHREPPKAVQSLGMRAIQALARQLDGEFIIERPPIGAAFAVVFPRSPA